MDATQHYQTALESFTKTLGYKNTVLALRERGIMLHEIEMILNNSFAAGYDARNEQLKKEQEDSDKLILNQFKQPL